MKKNMGKEGLWWAYLADYDGRVGSIRLDLGMRERVPVRGYTYVLVTGVTFESRRADGLPDSSDFARLNEVEASLVNLLESRLSAIHVGTFTHNFEQLYYFYLDSEAGVAEVLESFYQSHCAGCRTYSNLQSDPQWSYYSEFLFPNPEVLAANRVELKGIGFSVE